MSAVESAVVQQLKPSRLWMWILGVICLSLLGHGIAKQEETLGNLAYGIGYWLIPIGLGTVVFCAVFKASREYRWQVFAVLYGSAIAGHAIGLQFHEQEAVKAMDSMKQSMTAYANQINADPNAPAAPIELQPVTATASGDMGVMELVTKQLINDAAVQHNDYLKALDAAGWTMLLDVERLKKDPTMKESRAIIEASTAVVQQYRAKSFALLDSLPERAKQAPFRSETSRRQFLKGAEAGQVQGRKNNQVNWDYEEAIMREYAAVIEVFARSRGRFDFDKDNNVLFASDADVQVYNAHMTRADELIQKQAAHMKQTQEAAFNKFDSARPN